MTTPPKAGWTRGFLPKEGLRLKSVTRERRRDRSRETQTASTLARRAALDTVKDGRVRFGFVPVERGTLAEASARRFCCDEKIQLAHAPRSVCDAGARLHGERIARTGGDCGGASQRSGPHQRNCPRQSGQPRLRRAR